MATPRIVLLPLLLQPPPRRPITPGRVGGLKAVLRAATPRLLSRAMSQQELTRICDEAAGSAGLGEVTAATRAAEGGGGERPWWALSHAALSGERSPG